jgi:hypothetical protein
MRRVLLGHRVLLSIFQFLVRLFAFDFSDSNVRVEDFPLTAPSRRQRQRRDLVAFSGLDKEGWAGFCGPDRVVYAGPKDAIKVTTGCVIVGLLCVYSIRALLCKPVSYLYLYLYLILMRQNFKAWTFCLFIIRYRYRLVVYHELETRVLIGLLPIQTRTHDPCWVRVAHDQPWCRIRF